jgi:hypothetical protein
MTDFAFYDAAKLEKALGQRDALAKALEEIAAMDPKGIRADDLGRANECPRPFQRNRRLLPRA